MTPARSQQIEEEKFTSFLVGQSRLLKEARGWLCRAAKAGPYLNVMLIGESGTGKEVAARALSLLSSEHQKLFRALNCGGLSPELLESELFGYEKGAHGTAFNSAEGYLDIFSKAQGSGVLFLDELPEMHQSVQGKLLRFLETWTYRPLGGKKDKSAKIRIVSAMQPGFKKQIRPDLYHRVTDVEIRLPSLNDVLKDRPEDLELITGSLLDRLVNDKASTWEGKVFARADADTLFENLNMKRLLNHNWSRSNVRELRNYLRRLALMGIDQLIVDDEEKTEERTNQPENTDNNEKTWALPRLPQSINEVVGADTFGKLRDQYIHHVWQLLGDTHTKKMIHEKLKISFNTLTNTINSENTTATKKNQSQKRQKQQKQF